MTKIEIWDLNLMAIEKIAKFWLFVKVASRLRFFVSIEEIQQRLKEKAATAPAHIDVPKPEITAYSQLSTPELQERYNKLEAWMLLNKSHPRFYVADVRIKQMNKVLASRIKM